MVNIWAAAHSLKLIRNIARIHNNWDEHVSDKKQVNTSLEHCVTACLIQGKITKTAHCIVSSIQNLKTLLLLYQLPKMEDFAWRTLALLNIHRVPTSKAEIQFWRGAEYKFCLWLDTFLLHNREPCWECWLQDRFWCPTKKPWLSCSNNPHPLT